MGIFDKIVLYTPEDLPLFIRCSPLMAFEKGGGYWIWKPYILWKTLQTCADDDIVVYSDAGNCLRRSHEWNIYFCEMSNYDTIVFQYRNDVDYGWKDFIGCDSPKIKHWTKKTTLLYFDRLFADEHWREYNKILAGFLICKGKYNNLIEQWLRISLLYPELVSDPFGSETSDQEECFVLHRHDQSILTPLSYYFERNKTVLILPETCESQEERAAVVCKRLRYVQKIGFRSKVIRFIKSLIGDNMYKTLRFYR